MAINPNNLSIRFKQMLIVMLTSSVALLLACVAFMAYDTITFRQALVVKETGVAKILGDASAAAIDFDDHKSAEELLNSLRTEPNIIAACIYDRSGHVFTTYQRDAQAKPFSFPEQYGDNFVFINDQLHLFLPVKQAGDTIGSIFLASDLRELSKRLTHFATIAGIVFLLSLLIAAALSSQLQRVISDPILHLAKTARFVAREKNYSVRAARESGDELGELVDGFNEMLAQIQQRDAALEAARENLEQRVHDRTHELANSVSLLNATLESTTAGIVATDLKGNITSFNRHFAEMWRFPAELLESRNGAEMVGFALSQLKDGDREKMQHRIQETLLNPEISFADVVELKDGRIFDRHAIPQRIDNCCIGVVVSWRDITERRRAEKELRESQALYDSLVQHLPAGVFRKNAQGRFVFVNSTFCRIKGAKPEDYLGKTAQEVSREQSASLLWVHQQRLSIDGERHHATIMETGKPIEIEEDYPDVEGNVQSYYVMKSAVFGPDGKIIGSQGILFDITRRKKAEAELAHERQLLRSLLDSSPDHIYFKDQNCRVIRCSRSMSEKFGFSSPDDVIGKCDFDFFNDEHALPAFEDEQHVMATGEPIIGKIEKEVLKNGKVTWALTTKMPLRNKAGDIVGTFGISKDITAIKESEAQLELLHKQLLETSRQAGMAEVASSVLHNVGNVLNSVNVSATLAADRLKKSKVTNLGRIVTMFSQNSSNLGEYLTADPKGKLVPGYLAQLAEHMTQEHATAVAELESLCSHIEHIKDIVAMQQSYAKVSGISEIVKVTDLVEDSLRLNAGALARHEIELVRDFQPVPTVTIEKHKVLQILVNLIRNAKYACDESGRKDKRVILRVANGEKKIKISVTDNGIGIPPENLTRIFSHGFTTRKNGHGFGLHSGALAAKELGGRLVAQSEGPGKGATFILELPVT
jgi:PAS domain S-box-containing protein